MTVEDADFLATECEIGSERIKANESMQIENLKKTFLKMLKCLKFREKCMARVEGAHQFLPRPKKRKKFKEMIRDAFEMCCVRKQNNNQHVTKPM